MEIVRLLEVIVLQVATVFIAKLSFSVVASSKRLGRNLVIQANSISLIFSYKFDLICSKFQIDGVKTALYFVN